MNELDFLRIHSPSGNGDGGATKQEIDTCTLTRKFKSVVKKTRIVAESVGSEEDGKSQSKNGADEQDNMSVCCICMREFNDGDNVRLLPCMHQFHKQEIDKWLSSSAKCPICKTPIADANKITYE